MTQIECPADIKSLQGMMCLASYRVDDGSYLYLVHMDDQYDSEILDVAFSIDVYGKPSHIIPYRYEEAGVDTAYTLNNDGTMYGVVYGNTLTHFDGVTMAALYPLLLRAMYVCE